MIFLGVSESDMAVVAEDYPFMSPFISRWGCLQSFRAIYLDNTELS